MSRVIAVTGSRREGAVLGGLGVTVIAGGSDAAGLERQLADLAKGAAGIVSFGMAGALVPSLGLGDWVIGTSLAGSREGDCDTAWGAALASRLSGAALGRCYADGRLIAEVAQKQSIARRTGALCADMESHIVAKIAAEAGVPFIILRCISDLADAALPPAVAVAMRPDGGLALGAVLGSLVATPGQLPSLMRTATGFNRAFAALREGANAAGPRLAFDRR